MYHMKTVLEHHVSKQLWHGGGGSGDGGGGGGSSSSRNKLMI
jgi:hypothetical protein